MADLAALVVNLELQSAAFQRGMDQAVRQMEKMQRTAKNVDASTKRMADGLTNMGRAAISAAAAFASFETLKGIVQASDQLKALEGSFKALTGSGERATDMMGRIKSIAQETGAPLFSVGEAAQKLTVGLKSVGANNAQVAKITENFIKMGRVGGTSMADINGALIQFAQGLASGKLQGDEFRSVMERIPLIGELLAKELGVGVEQLKEMATNGEITAKVMAEALLKATADVNAKFAELPQTTEQAFNRVKNGAIVASAEINNAFNFSGIAVGGFQVLENSLKNITAFVKDLSTAWNQLDFANKIGIAGTAAAALVATFSGPLLVAIRATGAAMLTNPLLAILGAAAAAVLLIASNWDVVKSVILYDVPAWFLKLQASFSDLIADFIKDVERLSKTILDGVTSPFRDLMQNIRNLSGRGVSPDKANTNAPGPSSQPGKLAAGAEEAANKARERAAELETLKASALAQSTYAVGVAAATTEDFTNKVLKGAGASKEAGGAAKQQADGLQALLDKLFPADKAARDMEAAIKLLNDALRNDLITPEKYAEAIKKIPEAFSGKDGVQDTLNNILDQMNSFTKQFVDSVVDGIFEGKMNMEKLLKDMAKSITKWLLNQQIQKFFKMMDDFGKDGGSGGGGIFSSIIKGIGSIFGGGKAHGAAFNKGVEFFAQGGIVGSPTAFGMAGGRFGVMGEAGPEAIIPLKRSASGDLGVRSSPVNITVNNNAPVDVAVAEKEDPNGMKQIEIMIDRRVSKGFSDGTYDKPLRGAFGLTRQGY